MKGRPPKPAPLKLLQGNPGKREVKASKGGSSNKLPQTPRHLDRVGRYAYKKLVDQLGPSGIIQETDGLALELLADAYQEFRDARAAIKKHGGPTYETITESGSKIHRAYPEVAIGQDAWRRLKGMLTEFGLTPSSRSKINVMDPEVVDPMEGLLGGGSKG